MGPTLSRRRALTLLGASGIAAACSPDRPSFVGESPTGQRAVVEVTKPEFVPPPVPTTSPDDIDRSLVAQATVDSIEVFESIDSAEPKLQLDNPIASGGPLVFLVDEVADEWVKVLLPVRPNGSIGYVRADDITLSRHNYRIKVEIAETNLKILHRGELFFETRVAAAAEQAAWRIGRVPATPSTRSATSRKRSICPWA